MAELLPCPFCGVVPKDGTKYGKVKCMNESCLVQPRIISLFATGYHHLAADEWNKRCDEAPRLLAALEAIVEAGRMSDSSRARYCADIARNAINRSDYTHYAPTGYEQSGSFEIIKEDRNDG